MSDNDLPGVYNRYITYSSSSSDMPDYYTDLLNRINNILNWQSDIEYRVSALNDMVSKFSESEINNTINTKVTNAINELINDLNGELDRKLEKPNIKAGTNISLTKDANSNDITINDTINLNGYATKTYVTDEINKASLSGGTLNNLSVGGRNYIKNSIFANGLTYWEQHYSVSSIDTAFLFNNHATLKLSASGLTSDSWSGVMQHLNIDVAQGKTYTLSCYYYVQDLSTFDSALAFELKANREGLGDVNIGIAYIGKDSLIEGEWTKISATIPIKQTDISNLFVYL